MLVLKPDTRIHVMDKNNKPAAYASDCDTVVFETLDCFSGQLKKEDQPFNGIDWNLINPATGPLFIEGAKKGDVLKVEILKIDVDDHAVMTDSPREGLTGVLLKEKAIKIMPIENGKVKFNDKISLPLSPMIGVIGTAPENEGIHTGTPGDHGGNMDCKRVSEGATVYLPVHTEGALLSMGDLHAVMGDGEVCVCGAECAGKVTVRVSVIKNSHIPTPFIVNATHAMTIVSGDTADQAIDAATHRMHVLLIKDVGMSAHDASMLLSLSGDLRICQVVDPLKSVRMELPIEVFDAYGYCFA